MKELTTEEAIKVISEQSGYSISAAQVRNLCRKKDIKARKHGVEWAIDAVKLKKFRRKSKKKEESKPVMKQCGIKQCDICWDYVDERGCVEARRLSRTLGSKVSICKKCQSGKVYRNIYISNSMGRK